MVRVGLALSGGGARGIAHFGVMKALQEFGIEVNSFSGTSAGAVAAAFISHDYSPDEAMRAMSDTNLFKLTWPAFSKKGFLNLSKSEKIYKKYFPKDSFELSDVELFITATNLQKGKPEVFSSGSLSRAIIASCCIPFIFDPVVIGEYSYIDGGILNNLPSEPLKENCDFIIGVNVSPVLETNNFNGPKKLIERISMLALSSNVASSRKNCNLYFEPKELRKFGTFDFKKGQAIFDIGYEYALHELSLLKESGELPI